MRTLRWAGLLVLVGSLFALSGCLLDPNPVANFTWSPQEPIARADVQFTDQSTDSAGLLGVFGTEEIKTRNWDFDDSESSISQSPKHRFDVGGEYEVALTVEDGSGNTDTVTKSVFVSPSVDGVWTGTIRDANGVPVGLELRLTHSSMGISGMVSVPQVVVLPQQITGAAFDTATRTLTFQMGGTFWQFRGTLGPNETTLSGFWFNAIGIQINTWEVTRSGA